MADLLAGYRPTLLYTVFEDICRIPRGSGNEAGMADYLCAFARSHGLWHHRDGLHNVLIKKPGQGAAAGHAPVILQGHTDMVCEKNAGVAHDFERDPLPLKLNGEWLETEGTTLGADDGIAVALALALLADETAAHPPLECLFTVQEETGMDGAAGFDYGLLDGRTLINLDTENMDEAIVSCAGGEYGVFTFALPLTAADGQLLTVRLRGLAGDHSGTGIHTGKANAILLCGRLLAALARQTDIRLIALDGGGKPNAIPRECTARLAASNADAAARALQELAEAVRSELVEADRCMSLTCETGGAAERAGSRADTDRLLAALLLMPNGPLSRVPGDPDMVESSSNAGVIATADGRVTLTTMPRSSSESRLDEIAARMDALAALTGAEIRHEGRHPGWAYAPHSRVREVYRQAFIDRFGREPRIVGIHAGLECGVISDRLGGVDALSLGAKVENIHTPAERLHLPSLAQALELVKDMLARL